jgi:hypothetical protein
MGKNLTKIIGLIQGAAGLLGTASGGVSQALGTAQGGDIFNLVSGAVLGFLGLKVGLPTISGLNGLVGLLGLLGQNNPLSALQMNNGTGGSLINIAVSVIGFIASFMKNKAAAK